MILSPVLVEDLPAEDYFAHPALSASGAKALLAPGCPAKFHHEREHGRPWKAEYDFGHAAHKIILGEGDDLLVVDALDWKKPANQEIRRQARAQSRIPLLRHEFKIVTDMARALRRDATVGALFDKDRGRPEVSLFWHDPDYGIDRKCRLDWLPNIVDGTALIIPDYKTTQSADPGALSRQVANFNYHMQAAWYQDGVQAVLGVKAAFVFVAQEKDPPYLVQPYELDGLTMEIGRAKNADAKRIYADCTAVDVWPTWTAGAIATIGLPAWADRNY